MRRSTGDGFGRIAVVVGLLATAAACGDGPVAVDVEPWIEVTGRLERGSVVFLSVAPGGGAHAVPGPTFAVRPASAAEFLAPDRARLLVTGAVTFVTTVRSAVIERAVEVAAPPEIVFDLRRNGSRDLYRIELDGLGFTRLTQHPADDDSPTIACDRVVFVSYRDGPADLYTTSLAGGPEPRLSSPPGNKRNPALSRDGSRLAFTTDATGVPKLWVAAGDARDSRRLTVGFGFAGSIEVSPSWSPDGNRLVFVSTHEGNGNLYVHDFRTGAYEPFMVGAPAYVQPAWSPDGQWIAFTSNQDGSTDLYMKHVATRELRRLTNRAEADAQPRWLADGRLVFVSYYGAETRLRWMDPGRSADTTVIPVPAANPMNPAAR